MDGPNNKFQSLKDLILMTDLTSVNELTLAEYVLACIQMSVQIYASDSRVSSGYTAPFPVTFLLLW